MLLSVQGLGHAHEAVHPDRVDRVVGSVEVLFLEAVPTEPSADVRGQVRILTMPRPDHHCVLAALQGRQAVVKRGSQSGR